MVQFMSVAVPSSSSPPPLFVAEFPEIVQSVSVRLPWLYTPPSSAALPAVIERPEIDAVTLASI